jgi:hypothetical protein
MKADATEAIRRKLMVELAREAAGRATLERRHGQVWNPVELRRDFEVIGFLAPLAVVRRKSDSMLMTLMFQPQPRLYFNLKPDVG